MFNFRKQNYLLHSGSEVHVRYFMCHVDILCVVSTADSF